MVNYYKEGIWNSEDSKNYDLSTTMFLTWVDENVPVGYPEGFNAKGFYTKSSKVIESSADFIGASDDTYIGPLELIKWKK